MARDTDHLASSFETENTGGLLSRIVGRGGCFRPSRALAAWVLGRGCRSAPSSSPSTPTSRRIGMRRDQVAAADLPGKRADPVRRQGKPGRGPAAGLRHRDPQRRSRPAVFPRHRAGTGPGFHDRRDCAAKSPQTAAASPQAATPADDGGVPRRRRKIRRPRRSQLPRPRSSDAAAKPACPGCGRPGSRRRCNCSCPDLGPGRDRPPAAHQKNRWRTRTRASRPRPRARPPDRWRQIHRRPAPATPPVPAKSIMAPPNCCGRKD